jgi:glycerol-3-phosphate dehydrogenase
VIDLLVIGGGINGAGIARDAAGRGLSVTLVEQSDLASATSSWSSKLIHGGLRYLEQYEFRLVREALQEREVLLRLAPHIIRPLLFVLPHDRSMRPVWMIRTGLWMYDHIGGKITLPRSKAVTFPHIEYSAGLKGEIRSGFLYSDCRVDDSRLTVLNAMSAREKGATVMTRTAFEIARRVDGVWEAVIRPVGGEPRTVRARALVNAAGPWVVDVLDKVMGERIRERVRLVKGSHIIVPKVHSQGHALILQNPDKRVVFVIPYEREFSLIGTTDVAVGNVSEAKSITPDETEYLVAAANRFLARPIGVADVVHSYAGVRPLYDDGSDNPSEVTRDYVLKVDEQGGRAPLLTVFGGKITTYRRLAEAALARILELLEQPQDAPRQPWTAQAALPGGDFPRGDFTAFVSDSRQRWPWLPPQLLHRLARQYGSRMSRVLGAADGMADLGEEFATGLTRAEVDYLVAEEWARSSDDILWRRTKLGLQFPPQALQRLQRYLSAVRHLQDAVPQGL